MTANAVRMVVLATDDLDASIECGALARGPYDDAHERRAVVYDNRGNGLVVYKTLQR